MLCPFWRCFYRQLQCKCKPRSPPPHAHGCWPHRRREVPTAASRIVAYRLQRVKADFIVGSKDAANAFHSIKIDKAINTIPTALS
eukprot:2716022-Pyramimonas_sp.AAC.1